MCCSFSMMLSMVTGGCAWRMCLICFISATMLFTTEGRPRTIRRRSLYIIVRRLQTCYIPLWRLEECEKCAAAFLTRNELQYHVESHHDMLLCNGKCGRRTCVCIFPDQMTRAQHLSAGLATVRDPAAFAGASSQLAHALNIHQ